jgi:hypothetical protein
MNTWLISGSRDMRPGMAEAVDSIVRRSRLGR